MADEFEFLFDPNDESARIFKELQRYYGNFTEGVRQQLLAKNVSTPNNLLELSYQPRKEMVSKNVPEFSDVLDQSEQIRKELLSKLVSVKTDIGEESIAYRKDMLRKNNVEISDILSSSSDYRDSMLQKNVPTTSDIESSSEVYRTEDLTNNVSSESNIEVDSEVFRTEDLTNNVSSESNIEVDSEVYRTEDLTNNVSSESDIEADSEVYRTEDLTNNVLSTSDIEVDSEPYRTEDLTNNVLSESDIEVDSEPYRAEDLTNNVLSESDIEVDSEPYRTEDLTNNVLSTSDIEVDSEPYRTEDLTNNVLSESDIEVDSIPFRLEDLTNNVLSTSDIEVDSEPYRTEDLTNNVLSESDIEVDSIPFRVEDLTNNVLSESNIEVDSEDYRNEDLNNNVSSQSSILFDSHSPRQRMLASNQGLGLLGFNIEGLGTSAFLGISRNYTLGIIVRELLLSRNVPSYSDIETDSKNYREGNLIVNKYSSLNPYQSIYLDGKIKDGEYDAGGGTTVREEIADQFKRSQEVLTRPETKTYPEYEENLFFDSTARSTFETDGLGQMNKLDAGNEFGDVFDFRPKSIKNLMSDIVSRTELDIAQNYDPNSQVFALGGTDQRRGGIPKVARKRYTINNPYFTGSEGSRTAGKLLFSITNYATPFNSEFRTMFLPPYIQSFQENRNNNWNTHEFLGRPEPVYTYNNSTRGASISFFVLTDYAQDIELGTDWSSPDLDRILFNTKSTSSSLNIEGGDGDDSKDHFTQRWKYFIDISIQKSELIRTRYLNEKEIAKINIQIDEIINTAKAGNDFDLALPEDENLKEQLTALTNRRDELGSVNYGVNESLKAIENILSEEDLTNAFSESKDNSINTISTALGINSDQDLYMVERLRDMKETLQYQPAYFSGDKVDFMRKMTFLQRLFTPRRASLSEGMGFAFTKPPVAHLRLGDWLNHDIIITDMNIEYTDSTWSLEASKEGNSGVQPMFAMVTLNFNIIGQYGSAGGGEPLLANDSRGFYNTFYKPIDASKTVASVEAGGVETNVILNPNNPYSVIANENFQ